LGALDSDFSRNFMNNGNPCMVNVPRLSLSTYFTTLSYRVAKDGTEWHFETSFSNICDSSTLHVCTVPIT